MISLSARNCSASTNSTARNTNARNVSLLCSNADFTAGERTRSRNRATAAASGSLCVGGRFCHSKFCAALIALSITRSDFMEKKRVKLWCVPVRATSLVVEHTRLQYLCGHREQQRRHHLAGDHRMTTDRLL